MTAIIGHGQITVLADVTRADVEEFLYNEAALLDEWRLDEWARLFCSDGRYVVPSNDLPEGDPDQDMVLIDDDSNRIRARVERLNSRRAHREYPHARTSHQVTNVRLVGIEEDMLHVRAAFTVWRFRDQRDDHFVGEYRYWLRLVDGAIRIQLKRVVMQMTVLRPAGAVSIIL
jgi:p-cumate 2,3-dioxygenase beta subunit